MYLRPPPKKYCIQTNMVLHSKLSTKKRTRPKGSRCYRASQKTRQDDLVKSPRRKRCPRRHMRSPSGGCVENPNTTAYENTFIGNAYGFGMPLERCKPGFVTVRFKSGSGSCVRKTWLSKNRGRLAKDIAPRRKR
jgi:hypothetical protein